MPAIAPPLNESSLLELERLDEGLKEGLAVGVSSTVDVELDVHWASVLYPSPEAMDCSCLLK
jgi:hypothetical protein